MAKVLSSNDLIKYLQWKMDAFKKDEARWGLSDPHVEKRLDDLIACKEMVEAVIGEPVNLGVDGVVWVGFERED